ncbi:LysR family transcriptional regulator [Neptunomonas japonica]|uniref:LysR family transcriptional regulator n=1 Tax=Neptunomonas japonica JAMM 1380 TaxID=1441457 RepID=A0A7R6PGQ5_9GAMM|nr:LysR family transcriptional regulator [Neptunomonas japonica]BBB29902.1 LysR family transcriptional regulator [Neptunomonas japonica JAMM 1380]
MVDFNEVYVFIKVVEAGSFVGASKQLNMPSTTVSRKVQKLEDALGVRLLQRSTRKLHLTDIGQQYFESCQQSLASIEEATTLASESRSMPTGLLRITSPTDFAVNYLQPWINDFLRRYPDVQIELEVTDRYVDLIEERIDIAFRSGDLKDSSLIARRIGPKQSIFCASPDYLEKSGTPILPDDLSQHDCVIMGRGLKNQHWRFMTEEGEMSVPVKGRYAADNMQLVVEAAHNGMGVAQVPHPLVLESLIEGKLIQVLADYSPPKQSIYIIYPSHKYLARNVRTFIDHVIESTTPNPPWEVK